MTLELSIRARNLKNVAKLGSKSDPFAIVTRIRSAESDQLEILGRTEVLKNNLSPDWVAVFEIDYELGTTQMVAINIFDEVRNKKENNSMGSAVFDVGQLLGARGNTLKKQLKKGGVLIATVRKLEGSGILRIQVKGENLTNTEGMFGTSDPFFELSRKVSATEGHTWDAVYRSSHIRNNLDPMWDEATIKISTLCGGDLDAPISIKVYDHEKSGKHVLMGHAETSVNGLLQAAKNGTFGPMQLSIRGKPTGSLYILQAEISGLVDPSGATRAQTSSTSVGSQTSLDTAYQPTATIDTTDAVQLGSVVPMPPPQSSSRTTSCSIQKDLFLDYISGGCELNVVVAIDFTGSNGDPRIPGTLHYIDLNSRNPYEEAITSIVSILLKYDSDKQVPVFGFGAKYGGEVRHCFQCGPTPEAEGLQGVLDAYKSTFTRELILSRPTVIKEVLETAAKKADASLKYALHRGVQSYTILLIVTDGAVSDVKATAECLRRVSTSPLSVVIVGVGNEDFKAMQFLDDHSHQSGTRDIAQFVAFNEHSHSSQSLTKATLEEIPRQLVEFFRDKGIDPLPPIICGDDSIADVGNIADDVDWSLDFNQELVITGGAADFRQPLQPWDH